MTEGTLEVGQKALTERGGGRMRYINVWRIFQVLLMIDGALDVFTHVVRAFGG